MRCVVDDDVCALIPWDLVCAIPWGLMCAVDHIVDDDVLAMRLAYRQLSFSRYA